MAKKSLLIGAMTNYDFDKVAPWVKSINRTNFEGDKVMITFNVSYETVKKLKDNDFEVVTVGQKDDANGRYVHQSNLPIHVERFLHIYEYLSSRYKDYEYVITTDVKDVIFQTDPVKWLRDNLIGIDKHIVAGSEALRYKDEPWGNENLMQTYGAFIYEKFKNNEIFNVGTLAGSPEYIKDLVLSIVLNGINRPIPIVDQAVFNVMIQTQPYKDVTFFAKQCFAWACQAGTVADPSKMNAFRPFLLEAEPEFKDGYVYTSTGDLFCIVHQYDRVPAWKNIIEARYK